MRFVIFGAGAVGGVLGVRLHQSGHEVILIARGAHHDAIAEHGLTLETPDGASAHPIPVARDPAGAALSEDDVVLLCVKSQDTRSALEALRDARPQGVPVVLCQNGTENERVALRILPEVYGAVVLAPTAHLQAGIVQCFATGVTGKVDVGRYPRGTDAITAVVSEAFAASQFESAPNPDIMTAKYAKLLGNLANAPQAICGVGASGLDELVEAARAEGRQILDAAGISYQPAREENRLDRFNWSGIGEIPGRALAGGSTWQSLTRGQPLESDYLTGEIVLQARLHERAAPLNTTILELTHQAVREGQAPGWISPLEVRRRAGA